MADDTERARRASAFPLKVPDQQGAFPQPFERRMPLHGGGESRMGAHHRPFTNQEIKRFERASRLWRRVGMLLYDNPLCKFD